MQLHYIMDPMCSWCYAFSRTLDAVAAHFPVEAGLRYLMGGLAPDSNEPMPEETRRYVQAAWRTVAERTGASFNFDFWVRCQPRRSTYPACRAVITAGLQDETKIPAMVGAIQTAYYQQARNPSDESTLMELAGEIGLDAVRFGEELHSPLVQQRLLADFRFRDLLGVQGFPTLVLEVNTNYYALAIGYVTPETLQQRFERVLQLQSG